jgi:4-hydroxy-3-methylbut-2-en-1-yl diphosphate synthase IspG/GcpE
MVESACAHRVLEREGFRDIKVSLASDDPHRAGLPAAREAGGLSLPPGHRKAGTPFGGTIRSSRMGILLAEGLATRSASR